MSEQKTSDLVLYIIEQQDTSFSEKEFNDVDGLVLAELSYIDWSDLGITVPDDGVITLKDAIDKVLSRPHDMRADLVEFLKALADSERFGNMSLSNYADHRTTLHDEGVDSFEDLEQFAAVVITYTDENGDIQNYISYRGTDAKLEGWCEDFNMAYDTMTEAQRRAVEYLNSIAEHLEGGIQMGGHSKGGNDAVYAYLFCDESVRERINHLFTYDGPGLAEGICYVDEQGNVVYLDPEIYQQMLERLTAIGPHDSVIGMLLTEYTNTFVDTDAAIFLDHSAFTWKIDPETGEFVLREQSELSKYLDELFDEWILTVPKEDRKTFMVAIWGWIYSTCVGDFDAVGDLFKEDPIAAIESLIAFINDLPEDARASFIASLEYLCCLVADNALERLPEYGTVRDKILLELRKRNINTPEDLWLYLKADPLENTMDLLHSILSDWDTLAALGKLLAEEAVVNVILSLGIILLRFLMSPVAENLHILSILEAIFVTAKLAIDFIRERWEEVKKFAEMAIEYAQEKINEFVAAMKLAISTAFHATITGLVYMAEEVAEKFFSTADQVVDILQEMGKLAAKSLQTVLCITNPLMYVLVRTVAGLQQTQVTIDMPRLQNAVDQMDRIAGRVANIDRRLDSLYWKLCRNNIEQEEGIFTSLANMYHLSSADINVDEGRRIRRKADALSELYKDYVDVEKWVLSQIGG